MKILVTGANGLLGSAVTEEVLRRLRYDRATTEFVTQLVAVHGRPIPDH